MGVTNRIRNFIEQGNHIVETSNGAFAPRQFIPQSEELWAIWVHGRNSVVGERVLMWVAEGDDLRAITYSDMSEENALEYEPGSGRPIDIISGRATVVIPHAVTAGRASMRCTNRCAYSVEATTHSWFELSVRHIDSCGGAE